MAKDSVWTRRWLPFRCVAGALGSNELIAAVAGGLLVLAMSGCGTSEPVVMTPQHDARDSLRTANERLYDELRTASDSLQFYDDIYAGQYWRDRRRLEERIDRLRFQLARCADGGEPVQTYRADALFQPASATLTEAGKTRLDTLARQLQGPLAGRRLRIEGYTDDVPVGPSLREKYPSNWELSAARAGAVLRNLTQAHELDPARFEIVGYGPSRPVASNETASGRDENRRVRVTVLPSVDG